MFKIAKKTETITFATSIFGFADLWERLMHDSGDNVGKARVADKKERVSASGE